VGIIGPGIGVALVVGLSIVGCGGGGSSENDQGVSFRAVGILQGEVQEDQCQVPTADSAIADAGVSIPLNSPFVDNGYPSSFSVLSFCRGFLQLENNMLGQAVVVDRVDFEYEIPGARIAIPANSAPTGFRINPVDADPELTPSPFGQVNAVVVQLDGQLVPSTLVQFLRQNRQSLPALPYIMIIHIRARGRTDSGNLLETNEIRYTVEWTATPEDV
jgi:hypothetical protein